MPELQRNCQNNAELLKARQGYSLNGKIYLSEQRVHETVERYGTNGVYVAFSGGKDSTVLLDLVRRLYPTVPAVFCDTGLEYPEVRGFVKAVENVTWIRPKKSFKRVIEDYGYPIVSKRVAQMVHEINTTKSEKLLKRRLTGVKPDGTYHPATKIPEKWKTLCKCEGCPFSVSASCCDVMKKRPSKAYEKQTGRVAIVGTMATESFQRQQSYLQHGCNAFNAKRPTSRPLMVWEDADVWEYLRTYEVPYSPLYDRGYSRTGCAFCAFGVHMEKGENRFQRMKKTHPKLWNYCMATLGMREVLEYIGVPIE